MIGIYINSCGEDKDFPCIAEAKELGLNPAVFVNEISRIRDAEIPVLHAALIWQGRFIVVATCEITTKFLENIPTPLAKYTLCDTIDIEGITKISSISEIPLNE